MQIFQTEKFLLLNRRSQDMYTASHNTGKIFISVFQKNKCFSVYNVSFSSRIRIWPGKMLGTRFCYKPEDRRFDSRWGHSDFSLTASLWPWGRLSVWFKWVPRISSGDKDGRCVRLTYLPPSRADYREILGASNSGSPKCPSMPVWTRLYLYLDIVWTVYHLVMYMQSNKIHKVF